VTVQIVPLFMLSPYQILVVIYKGLKHCHLETLIDHEHENDTTFHLPTFHEGIDLVVQYFVIMLKDI
jgi:hypothetical protein